MGLSRFILIGALGWLCIVGLTETSAAAPKSTSDSVDVCAEKVLLPTVAALHRNSAFLRAYDSNCNGIPDRSELLEAERDQYQKLQSMKQVGTVVPPPAEKAKAGKTKGTVDSVAPVAVADKPAPSRCPPGWSGYPILRDSYADIHGALSTDCPPSLKGVKGAQFSWARNGISDNDQWLAKGVAGARFMWLGTGVDSVQPYINLIAISPIVRFQRVLNSNPKLQGNNIDILSPGISSEMLVNQLLDPQLQLYFRARANVNGDFEGKAHSWSGAFEVQPIYDPLRIGTNIPIGYSYWTFSPLVRAQYFGRMGGAADPLFLNSNRVLRAGPALSLDIVAFDGDPVPSWLRNITFNLTYTQYQELLRQRSYGHLNTTLTYNVTDNFGLSLSYERGKIDETGQNVDLTMLALSVKY
jgi:type II secretory pathway component PulJ